MLRYDIINWLIEKYGYNSYLEIGVAQGECWKNIVCQNKYGAEPDGEQLLKIPNHENGGVIDTVTSDEFFSNFKSKDGQKPKWLHDYFDIIFIDGDHHEGQVIKDIHNSLEHLYDGGTIVLHDCNPPTEGHAAEKPTVKSSTGDHYLWNGTVWKAWVKMRMLRFDLECRCVDADWGCGIIQRGDSLKPPELPAHNLSFAEFAHKRKEYLNLITVDEFKEIYVG